MIRNVWQCHPACVPPATVASCSHRTDVRGPSVMPCDTCVYEGKMGPNVWDATVNPGLIFDSVHAQGVEFDGDRR
jgi:hypothetical protein